MIDETRITRNRLTGVIDKHTPIHILDHPVLGKNLEVVEDDAKPLVAELINTDKVEAKGADAKVDPKTEKKDD